jgi:anaerobic C4-dicarboxylate transporter DcuA
MLWFELAILLICILVGSRLGGIGLGAVAGVGLALFVLVLGLPPGAPPGTVLGMILAVITAVSLMQAAGGLDWVVQEAERLLRRNPRRITLLAPLVTYGLILASGTQHVIYALLPVIAEVARKGGVRPERPLSMSVIAAQQGLIASPVSAATVGFAAAIAGLDLGLPQILAVIVPATLVGVLAGVAAVSFVGKELADDPEYQRRLASGELRPPEERPPLQGEALRRAVGCCAIFALAIVGVVVIGLFPDLRPVYERVHEGVTESGQVEMGRAIMILMLAASGAMVVLLRADPAAALKGSIMNGGLAAIINILGLSWLGSSFFEANQTAIVGGISEVIRAHPWIFALGLFGLSVLLFSQAATIVTLIPVGLALGLSGPLLIGVYPAVNGNFFLPTYGTVLAAVSFDQTGTTRIGKYLLNHSFMLPGLVTTITSTVVALGIARLVID